jgi:hypothetical protein
VIAIYSWGWRGWGGAGARAGRREVGTLHRKLYDRASWIALALGERVEEEVGAVARAFFGRRGCPVVK